MTVRRITIEYEDGTSEVLTPAEWMGAMLGSRTPASSDSTTNSSSVDYIQETFQSARNLVSAVEEEEIAVEIEPLPEPSVPDATVHASPVRVIEEEPVTPPANDDDKAYRQATVLRFPFGGHKGKTILELVLEDRDFAEKCVRQLGDNGKHRELASAIKLILERHPDI